MTVFLLANCFSLRMWKSTHVFLWLSQTYEKTAVNWCKFPGLSILQFCLWKRGQLLTPNVHWGKARMNWWKCIQNTYMEEDAIRTAKEVLKYYADIQDEIEIRQSGISLTENDVVCNLKKLRRWISRQIKTNNEQIRLNVSKNCDRQLIMQYYSI